MDHHVDRSWNKNSQGRYMDNNSFIERLWRSLKQEAIYLQELTDGYKAKKIIDEWINFYNSDRPHTALDKRVPDSVCFGEPQRQKRHIYEKRIYIVTKPQNCPNK